ncbi:50S ribosomal protein L19e [Candidatus Pacearchaeota archaeon]|nr:50S ribosomal protein L19e [Candidatus Pacearchaeota archaeon]
MNLAKKKLLAAKILKVGKNRVAFSPDSLSEIKEAITKQDIKNLYDEAKITIKPVKGRRKIIKRMRRRGPGKIKKKIKKRKQLYVKLTRKLRGYLKELKNKNMISKDVYWELRKKIRAKSFKSKAHIKEYLKGMDIKTELEKRPGKPRIKKIQDHSKSSKNKTEKKIKKNKK